MQNKVATKKKNHSRYRTVDISKSVDDIVNSVIQLKSHVLLKPPRFNGSTVAPSPPAKTNRKMVGIFTSGTTGNQQCIWNSFANLTLNARMSRNMFDISNHHSILIIANPWHIAGLSWALMAEDGGNLYHIMPARRKQASLWPRLISDLKPDILITIPTILRLMYQGSNWFVPAIVCGGEPIKPSDYTTLKKHSNILYQAYGQTEAGGLISVHRRDLKQPPGFYEYQCYGYAPPDCKLRCEGSSESPAPIYLKSPTSIYTDWYDTGDIGFMDSLNRLYLSGRQDR